MNPTLKITLDGSPSFYSPQFNEHYHSIHGAWQESMHVFINHGLHAITSPKTPLRILEVGFGTGLNAWLTFLHATKPFVYTAIEAYPLPQESLEDYAKKLNLSPEQFLNFQHLHASKGKEPFDFHPHTFHWIETKLEDFVPTHAFDLIYFDAFAPNNQPELWTQEIFAFLGTYTNPGGILVTYCAKGSVKRAMRAAGWEVFAPPGPLRKREMIQAKK